jgi:hypothetical protein
MTVPNSPTKAKSNVVSPKVPRAADAAKHTPKGGNVEICQITYHINEDLNQAVEM